MSDAVQTLDQQIPPGVKLPPPEALRLLRRIAVELDRAHASGNVHGSLFPGNILVSHTGEIHLQNLRPLSPPDPASLLPAVDYLSPEFIRDGPTEPRSDQFSLAVLAYRLLTGVLPFSGTAVGAMFRIAFTSVERSGMRDLIEPAQSVLLRGLSNSPEARYASCSAMVDALEAAFKPRPVMAPTRIAPLPLPPSVRRGD